MANTTSLRGHYVQTFCNWLAFVRYGYFSELENSRDAFLAAMSHEMRMPLNSILAMNDLILMDSHDPAILEYASKSKASCQTLLDLVNDIIDYSQMESGQFVIEEGAIPVQELFTSLYALAEPMASRKNLKLFSSLTALCLPDSPETKDGWSRFSPIF